MPTTEEMRAQYLRDLMSQQAGRQRYGAPPMQGGEWAQGVQRRTPGAVSPQDAAMRLRSILGGGGGMPPPNLSSGMPRTQMSGVSSPEFAFPGVVSDIEDELQSTMDPRAYGGMDVETRALIDEMSRATANTNVPRQYDYQTRDAAAMGAAPAPSMAPSSIRRALVPRTAMGGSRPDIEAERQKALGGAYFMPMSRRPSPMLNRATGAMPFRSTGNPELDRWLLESNPNRLTDID